MHWFKFLCLFGFLALLGCGGGSVDTGEPQEDITITEIKRQLQQIVDTGDMENVEEMQSYIEEDLAGIDEAMSQSLMTDYNELKSLSGQEAKDKAQAMIDKL